ncbi:MAG: AmmeMemoRadiSam system protein B [Vicinamibacterales bacterium]
MAARPAAVAGTWYPGTAGALRQEVEAYLAAADVPPLSGVSALVAPHAGLMFSGPVGAYAYKTVAGSGCEVIFLVGPSHFLPFEGVSVWPDGEFASPLGPAVIDQQGAADILADPVAHVTLEAHRREHSIEMQLPFIRIVLPRASIVPMLMGFQRRDTIEATAQALTRAARGRRALLVASTDLSHYFDAIQAATLDGRVREFVRTFDADGLLQLFEQYPEQERGRSVACGGGPAIAVMKAARALGASNGRVLKYAHSGEVSGDYDGVVGYLAGAFGRFPDAD